MEAPRCLVSNLTMRTRSGTPVRPGARRIFRNRIEFAGADPVPVVMKIYDAGSLRFAVKEARALSTLRRGPRW